MHQAGQHSRGDALALWMSMDNRRTPDRRRQSRSGRRASDPHLEPLLTETRREVAQLKDVVARLKDVVQNLADAVQALTGARRKP
jgi:hypothetical protein